MSKPFAELSQAELDGLIERVKEAADYGLALSAEDLQWLLNALLMLAQLQVERADQDVTLRKRRKLAGFVNRSEKLKHLAPGGALKKPSMRQKPKPFSKPPAEAVVHERCQHALEQALKRVIRGRKKALFFKTPAGAAIADVITSVIATAHHAGINAFDYLIALQRHAKAVKDQPERWLPWNYQALVEAKKKAA